MTKLTDRTLLATQSANDDIIHLVDVSDTSQDPAGSSFKAKRSQIATQTFADAAARALAVPGFIGQLGVQLDTGAIYRSNGTTAGSWVSPTYQTYVAFISQTSTNAPTVDAVLENTIGAVTFGYVSPGIYSITKAGAFGNLTTTVQLFSQGTGGFQFQGGYNSANDVYISTRINTTNTLTDGIMTKGLVMIRVYS